MAALDRAPLCKGGLGGWREDEGYDEEERAAVLEGARRDPAPAPEGGRGKTGDQGRQQRSCVRQRAALARGGLEGVAEQGFRALRLEEVDMLGGAGHTKTRTSTQVFVMKVELSPKERVSKITEILADGVLALLRSLPFAWAVSRIKVSESVKMQIVSANQRELAP